jgi:RimJ/RimL family protein N-acetyltransferase
MDLLITDPISEDYLQYHDLITQPHIQKEFLNFRNQKLTETKEEIDYWVNNHGVTLPHFLRFLKLTNNSSAVSWNASNSNIIGFIANLQAGPIEELHSGFNSLINFGISEEFQGKGMMSIALNMTISRLIEMEFNISTAFVKPHNIASAKVLEKCGYDIVRQSPLGTSYARALKIDLDYYKQSFNLQ